MRLAALRFGEFFTGLAPKRHGDISRLISALEQDFAACATSLGRIDECLHDASSVDYDSKGLPTLFSPTRCEEDTSAYEYPSTIALYFPEFIGAALCLSAVSIVALSSSSSSSLQALAALWERARRLQTWASLKFRWKVYVPTANLVNELTGYRGERNIDVFSESDRRALDDCNRAIALLRRQSSRAGAYEQFVRSPMAGLRANLPAASAMTLMQYRNIEQQILRALKSIDVFTSSNNFNVELLTLGSAYIGAHALRVCVSVVLRRRASSKDRLQEIRFVLRDMERHLATSAHPSSCAERGAYAFLVERLRGALRRHRHQLSSHENSRLEEDADELGSDDAIFPSDRKLSTIRRMFQNYGFLGTT